ncbi:CHAP domain-containing protein [Solibaculum mannosilyticum]|uniref:CHAP domain-containing protein n=1 Tax=Solibaculum mannosilyticum TaxID=2780922 RepID=UPI0034B8BCCC
MRKQLRSAMVIASSLAVLVSSVILPVSAGASQEDTVPVVAEASDISTAQEWNMALENDSLPEQVVEGSEVEMSGNVVAGVPFDFVQLQILDETGEVEAEKALTCQDLQFDLSRFNEYPLFEGLDPGDKTMRVAGGKGTQTADLYISPLEVKPLVDASDVSIPSSVAQYGALDLVGTLESEEDLTSVSLAIYDENRMEAYLSIACEGQAFDLSQFNGQIDTSLIPVGDKTMKITATTVTEQKVVYEDSLEVLEAVPSELALDGFTAPAADYVKGADYSFAGTVSSNYPVQSVTMTIQDADGNVDFQKSLDGGDVSFDLAQFNEYFVISSLPSGDKTITIDAADALGSQTLAQEAFAVTTPADQSALAISGLEMPSTHQKGKGRALKGEITSNYLIQWVNVDILNASGEVETGKKIEVGATSFSLSNIDPYIAFSKLSAGQKTLVVTAADEGTEKQLFSQEFTVEEPVVAYSSGSSSSSSSGNSDSLPPVSSGTGAQAMISVAASQIGYHEASNGYTKYGDWYGMPTANWCTIFVAWCADQAGVLGTAIPNTGSTTACMSWFQQRGRYFSKGSGTPQPGDICFMKFDSSSRPCSHVALVEYTSGGKVYTIEGNNADQVIRRSYTFGSARIVGYGRPAY